MKKKHLYIVLAVTVGVPLGLLAVVLVVLGVFQLGFYSLNGYFAVIDPKIVKQALAGLLAIVLVLGFLTWLEEL